MATTMHEAIMRAKRWAWIPMVAASVSACLPAHDANKAPIAVLAASVAGAPVAQDQIIPFDGTSVTMTLDGRMSHDPDGQVVSWVWMRTDVPASVRNSLGAGAAGMAAGAAGASGSGAAGGGAPAVKVPTFTGDPAPGPTAQVTFTETGKYRYTLWARDNSNAYSTPVSLRFQVGGFTPDPACAAAYTTPKADCKMCACAANTMGGCLTEFGKCFNNSDDQFSMLCKAIINCGIAKNCSGATCYTAALCMAEIDAAAMYTPGGNAATACPATMADTNPCGAANAFNACLTMTSMCVDVCK
jgi:hypothetical protein